MAKKTRSERKAKQKQDAAVKEKEARLDDEDDDEDDDDDEEETLNMAAEADAPADPDLMHIEFSFFDPRESDFHGMRNLLSGGGLIPSAWDVGGMAGILCEQAEVGGVVKTVGKGSDEPDDDVLGFLSVVNLHTHRDSKCVQQVLSHRVCGLGAKASDTTFGVVARKRRKINQGDGAQHPGRLVVFLNRAAPGQGGSTTLDCRGIGLNRCNAIQIKHRAGIARLLELRKMRKRCVGDRGGSCSHGGSLAFRVLKSVA